MKISTRKPIHTGNQPICVLKHNLTTRLVERNEKYIEQLQSDFKLNKNIKYHIADLSLIEKQCPFIDQNGLINIHETYLSYVWITCYYFFVLHEELLVIPDSKKRNLPIRKEQNLELFETAKELFNYGLSLIKVYSKWDIEYLPNPDFFDDESEEGWYILRTNDLFVEALNFILYHETAHAEFQHIKKVNTSKLFYEDQKQLEIEADTRAIELIISKNRNQNATELSIIIGLASMLFFKNNLSGGKKHPDIDSRLENAIKILELKDDSSVWSMLCLFIKEWSIRFDLNVSEKGSYENYKELYYKLMTQVKNCC